MATTPTPTPVKTLNDLLTDFENAQSALSTDASNDAQADQKVTAAQQLKTAAQQSLATDLPTLISTGEAYSAAIGDVVSRAKTQLATIQTPPPPPATPPPPAAPATPAA